LNAVGKDEGDELELEKKKELVHHDDHDVV
jgi:hypothetical protein